MTPVSRPSGNLESAAAASEMRAAAERERIVAATVATKAASRTLAVAAPTLKIELLRRIAAAVESSSEAILAANTADVTEAEATGSYSTALLHRLRLDRSKIATMAEQIRAVAALDDPVGRILEGMQLDDGLTWRRVSCPLGVILTIIEARPDAVTQIVALALKSGNAVLLKVGTEARRTARVIVDTIHRAIDDDARLPTAAVALVDSRAAVDTLLELDHLVDLVVPRGSAGLVRSIMARSRIPVLGHAAGVCHLYLDAAADATMAIAIAIDAKTQYPAACNAIETLLVHAEAVPTLLDRLAAALLDAGVELRGCDRARAALPSHALRAATSDDWGREYGDLVLAIRIVDDIHAAVDHIGRYGSGHTEAIVTADPDAAAYFLARVDAAGVFHNASTRFADGHRYGFGAEVGISTSKLHARGPVGLAGLTTYKYLLEGSGQTVAPYTGPEARSFRHRPLDTSR